MSKNLVPIIAKELGVEIGEEFNVTGYAKTIRFKFDETGLLWIDECEKIWAYTDVSTFFRLIDGDVEIIKLPFEPKTGDEYWTYSETWEVEDWVWTYDFLDLVYKRVGIVFRTKEEAIEARPAKYKELTGKEWQDG